MSETTTTDTTTPPPGTTEERTFTQADVDRIIAERLKRENIPELRSAAAELAKLRDNAKSEEAKVADRIAALEAAHAAAANEALRLRIGAKYGISEEVADVLLTGTDEATLTKQAEQAKALAEQHSKKPNVVPKEGTTTSKPGEDPVRAMARDLFRRGDD